MARYRDFDAFFAELKREPVKFKLLGEEVVLPPDIPAALILEIIHLTEKYAENMVVPHQDLWIMFETLVGKKKAREFAKKGLDGGHLRHVVPWIIQQYVGIVEEEAKKNLEELRKKVEEIERN